MLQLHSQQRERTLPSATLRSTQVLSGLDKASTLRRAIRFTLPADLWVRIPAPPLISRASYLMSLSPNFSSYHMGITTLASRICVHVKWTDVWTRECPWYPGDPLVSGRFVFDILLVFFWLQDSVSPLIQIYHALNGLYAPPTTVGDGKIEARVVRPLPRAEWMSSPVNGPRHRAQSRSQLKTEATGQEPTRKRPTDGAERRSKHWGQGLAHGEGNCSRTIS